MIYLKIFLLVFLQNASFTLVSRARTGNNMWYHMFASVLSNGIWLLVIRQVVLNLESPGFQLSYLVGAVSGSVLMHYIAIKHIEEKEIWKRLKAKLLQGR